jgi:hypothetical protein
LLLLFIEIFHTTINIFQFEYVRYEDMFIKLNDMKQFMMKIL